MSIGITEKKTKKKICVAARPKQSDSRGPSTNGCQQRNNTIPPSPGGGKTQPLMKTQSNASPLPRW